jgi:NLI interacting factor-like phosphatase
VTNKWLNVVLDLNGILCVCEDAKFKGWSRPIGDAKQPQSATTPTVVGPELVYVRPNCTEFLREIGQIAVISVWNSMKKPTTEEISEYLFVDQEKPFLVLASSPLS